MKNTLSPALRRFNYLHSETDAAYHELCLKLGISDSAMNLLYILCEQGDPCPLQLVYRFAFSSKQTVHSALRKLESEGVLRLEGDGPRNKQVCLTEKGRALVARTALRMIQAEDAVFASWPEEDVAQYLALSERYLTALREQVRQL